MNRLTKIRDNIEIKTKNDKTIKRNLYSYYVSNNNPVYCRYNNKWILVKGSFIGDLSINAYKIDDLHDMINTTEFNAYEGETVLSLQHRIINNGFYGDTENVTHSELIECQRDFIENNDLKLPDRIRDKLLKELDKIEKYHIKHETIDDQF